MGIEMTEKSRYKVLVWGTERLADSAVRRADNWDVIGYVRTPCV